MSSYKFNLFTTTLLLLGPLYPFALISLTSAATDPASAITDILFLVDASPNMCQYSESIADGILDFVTKLSTENIDTHFAVAAFGGLPTLLNPFSALTVCSIFPSNRYLD
jgi:hypothetical protein